MRELRSSTAPDRDAPSREAQAQITASELSDVVGDRSFETFAKMIQGLGEYGFTAVRLPPADA